MTIMKQVEVVEKTLVAPSKETPRQPLWLSNLDLAVPMTHAPLVYYYPATTAQQQEVVTGVFAPEQLKAALAGALVPFYPLAGRLGADPDGRPQLECNGDGVLFVVARADDLNGDDIFENFEPTPEIREAFVPAPDQSNGTPGPIAMFQVTFLKCGGVVLGTAIHHVLMDGLGAFHFIQTWAGLARGLDIVEACGPQPFHDRTPLRARSPPRPIMDHSCYDTPTAQLNTGHARPFVVRLYNVSPKLLTDLKSRCGGASNVSTYCAVTAHFWRCVCVARGFTSDSDDTRLGVAVNIRHRVSPPLPRSFFGNAVVRDIITAPAGDVLDSPLGAVAEKIKKAVDHVDDGFARSVVDYLELLEERKGGDDKKGGNYARGPLWSVSWLGMSMYNADFGSGTPRLVAPAQMLGVGSAYMTPCADKDQGINIVFAMETENIECFEKVFYGE